jgi:hypothetical protein
MLTTSLDESQWEKRSENSQYLSLEDKKCTCGGGMVVGFCGVVKKCWSGNFRMWVKTQLASK